MTLVKLEQSPNTYQTRYSFMFPKVGRGKKFAQFELEEIRMQAAVS